MIDLDALRAFHDGTCSTAYEIFGCHSEPYGGYVFRVWAPHASSVSLVLNGRDIGKMSRMADGESYEITCPEAVSGDLYSFRITTFEGRQLIKSDPFAFRSNLPHSHNSVICDAPVNSGFRRASDPIAEPVNIFEVNLLSWKRKDDGGYLSFAELEEQLVPYVADMGYTHVEFMPVTEYPFDGSWGYQVTGYFSVTDRLGTPEDFASLVRAFHRRNIGVILDWVPAHFPKDDFGLYEFDGQPLYECALWDNMEHRGWGTRKFDYGRAEVRSFLMSSAAYFAEKFGVDGLRVDAVASMIYLDYDKGEGQWTPNVFGDNRNLDAIDFLKLFNTELHRRFPGIITVAEESTAFSGVTSAPENGGLGFDFKWNMGWMNDVLFYCRQDPLYRHYHHTKITFSMMYSLNERYILPLSHDEVVHVKGSIVNKFPGEYADKFAGMRGMLGFMYAHPGKKLNFMGYEVAQFAEWDYTKSVDYFLTRYEKHAKMRVFVKALNELYKNCPPLYRVETDWSGFEWLVVDDVINNVLSFNRRDDEGNVLMCVVNFSGIDQPGYRIGQHRGKYRLVLDTDRRAFGGDGKFRKRVIQTKKISSHGKEHSVVLDIPKLACLYFLKDK